MSIYALVHIVHICWQSVHMLNSSMVVYQHLSIYVYRYGCRYVTAYIYTVCVLSLHVCHTMLQSNKSHAFTCLVLTCAIYIYIFNVCGKHMEASGKPKKYRTTFNAFIENPRFPEFRNVKIWGMKLRSTHTRSLVMLGIQGWPPHCFDGRPGRPVGCHGLPTAAVFQA